MPDKIDQEISFNIDPVEIEASIGKYSENPNYALKKQGRIQLIGYGTRINTPAYLLENQGQVAGAYSEKINSPEKHWVVEIVDDLFLNINSGLNWVLNRI